MKLIIYIVLIVIALNIKAIRCLLKNWHRIIFYSAKDLINYIRFKKWKEFNEFGMSMYIGDWGQGKTQSAAEQITYWYKRYGIDVLSNTPLNDIPWKPLNNYKDILDISNDKGTVVLMDEVELLLSKREWAKFPLSMLIEIMQCRKKRVKIILTCPEFTDADIILRDHTNMVIMCSKVWRLQNNKAYNKRDIENCVDPSLLKPLSNRWWFVKDKHRKMYDTYYQINNIEEFKAENYVSNEELVKRVGVKPVYPKMADLNRKGKKRIKK